MTPTRDRLQAALAQALRSRDPLRTSILRTTLSAIANAESVDVEPGTTATEVPRRELSEEDVQSIVAAERAELESTAAELRDHGRDDAAEELNEKAAVLADFLVGP